MSRTTCPHGLVKSRANEREVEGYGYMPRDKCVECRKVYARSLRASMREHGTGKEWRRFVEDATKGSKKEKKRVVYSRCKHGAPMFTSCVSQYDGYGPFATKRCPECNRVRSRASHLSLKNHGTVSRWEDYIIAADSRDKEPEPAHKKPLEKKTVAQAGRCDRCNQAEISNSITFTVNDPAGEPITARRGLCHYCREKLEVWWTGSASRYTRP